MGKFLTVLAILLSTTTQAVAAEQCKKAVATETPCAGVVMPRDWALECAVLKQRRPALPVVAKAPIPWYVGLLIGVPLGAGLYWGLSK